MPRHPSWLLLLILAAAGVTVVVGGLGKLWGGW